MRHLLDTYIRADESKTISTFDDKGLVELLVERGLPALNELPEGIRNNEAAMFETIENNIRKVIIDEQSVNPKYYDKMSELLDALIRQRKEEALDYKAYLNRLVELAGRVQSAPSHIDDEAVSLAIVSKLLWMRRHQERFADQPRQPQREMVSGESYYYLGRRYLLRVKEHGGPNSVTLNGTSELTMHLRPGTDRDKREQLLNAWYRHR
jgi:hypothetical protein